MAEKIKPYQFGSSKPNTFTGSTTATTPATATAPALDPGKLPPVARPETTTEEPVSGGFLGGALNVLDNIIPDDMGGVLRGESGWTENIPLYDQTVGAAADFGLTGGESIVNAINWGTEQMNHLGAAAESWMPGGIQTLDWEQSQKVSYGQVTSANAALALKDMQGGNWFNSALSMIGTNSIAFLAMGLDPNNAAMQTGFNILDENDRKAAFQDSAAGMWGSGLSDALWSVVADPTIVGGKFSAVLRTGLKAGEFAGLSNRALATAGQVEKFAIDADKGALYVASKGAQGEPTAAFEHIQNLITQPAHQLDNNVFVKSSSNPDLLKRLAVQVGSDRPDVGVALVTAAQGYRSGWERLVKLDINLHDQLASGMGINALERLPGQVDLSVDQLAYGKSVIEATLAKTDGVLDDSLRSDLVMAARGDQLITRGGNQVSAKMARAANAYRSGALRNQFGVANAGPSVVSDIPVLPKSQWVSTTLQAASGSRPVRAVRWLGQGSPTGIVHLKGGDGNNGSQEVIAFLRKSSIEPAQSAELMHGYTIATTVEQRKAALVLIENAEVEAIAAKHGIPATTARALYDTYSASRGRHLKTLVDKKAGFAADDGAEELVTTGNLYSQVDGEFPMLNQAVFRRVTSQNHRWLSNVEDLTVLADTANTWWKLSVLLRLGYTQRNLAEGGLRSVAALGLAALNPKAFLALPANTVRYSKTLGARRTVKNESKLLTRAHENLLASEQLLFAARKDAKVPRFLELNRNIRDLDYRLKKIAEKTMTKSVKKEQQAVRAERAVVWAEREDLRTKYIDPAQPNLKHLSDAERVAFTAIQTQKDAVLAATRSLRTKQSKRTVGGTDVNVMDDGTSLPGAFMGPEGTMAALLSSADKTLGETMNIGLSTRQTMLKLSGEYKHLDPADMAPSDMNRYFSEYTERLNQSYRNDAIIQMWLKKDGSPSLIDDTTAWLASKEGKFYRDNVETADFKLQTAAGEPIPAAIEKYVQGIWAEFSTLLPKNTGLRRMLLDGPVSSTEVQASLAGHKLPAIMARETQPGRDNLWSFTHRKAQEYSGTVMKYLGSVPETKMLRHPFYNNIYKERQNQLYRLAAQQGSDMSDVVLRTSINRGAHAAALKATRDTMYTIERLSNSAQMLRWVSPFFPAWENSVRTWSRIAYQNPSVLGWGDKLWNIPNNFGWVVDPKQIDPETGEPKRIEHSNMFGGDNEYIVYPKPVADFLAQDYFFVPGEALTTRQGNLNVIFPGGEPWFPGVGPSTMIPVALALRGRPAVTDIVRSKMSQEMFINLVPNGNPNTSMFDIIASTGAKRGMQLLGGTSQDGAFLSLTQTMLEDEYIRAQLEDRTVTQADMKRVMNAASHVQQWQILAAYAAPAQSSMYSQFAPQRSYWMSLQDDASLDWNQKTAALLQKFPEFGDALLTITRSGSMTESRLKPNLSTYKKLTENPAFVSKLDAIDPKLVGMFANMGSFDDPFSPAVYSEYRSMTLGNTGKSISHQMNPDQIIQANEVADGWRQWNQVKSVVQAKAVSMGGVATKLPDSLQAIQDTAEARLKEQFPAWAIEKESYANNLSTFLAGSRLMVENKSLVGEDKTIAALDQYLQVRDMVAGKKSQTTNKDERAALDQVGYQAAANLRDTDIGFADFYDQYLSGDDFRVS